MQHFPAVFAVAAALSCRLACATVLAQPEPPPGDAAVTHKTNVGAAALGVHIEIPGQPAASPALFRRELARPAAAAAAAGPAADARSGGASGIDWLGVLRVLWLTTSSLAFLAPAFYAHLNGLTWFTVLFATQAVASWAYQFCDAGAPQVLLGAQAGCVDPLATTLRHLDHGLGYLICLQLALAFLGPEDPGLQRISENAEAHLGVQARRRRFTTPIRDSSESVGLPWLTLPAGPHLPQDVIVFSRVVPVITLLVFLQTYSSPLQHFDWECTIWCATMLLLSIWTFWMKRREFATSVLLRLGFWRRVIQCMLLPLGLIAATFSVMQQTGNPAGLRGMWHVVVSALAVFVIWRVLLGDSVTFMYDDPVRNPIIAHYILLVMPTLAVATMVLTVVLDMAANPGAGGALAWPSLAVALARAPGEYIFMMGTMCTAMSAAATWRLVDMVCAYHEEMYQRGGERREVRRSIDKWVSQSSGGCKDAQKPGSATPTAPVMLSTPLPFRQAAHVLDSIAVALALVGATLQGELRASSLIGFLTLEAMAIVLNTMSAFKYGVPNHARVLVSGMLLVNTMGFLGTFQDTMLIPDWMSAYREAIYNCHGAAMVGLYLLWPLTWVTEAQAVMPVLVQWNRVCS